MKTNFVIYAGLVFFGYNMSDSIKDIGMNIESIQHLLVDVREGLFKKYNWKEDDARLTLFNKCSTVFISLNLGYVFIYKYLSKEDWWKENQHLPMERKTIENAINEFEMFMRISLIQYVMYSVESSFRIYVRTIDPVACKNGNAEFKSIYDYLLSLLSLKEFIPLLDLWRNIRNCMHNNGIFMPAKMVDSIVVHRGLTYKFEVGKPNDFVTTLFMLNLVPEIIIMMVKVVTSSVLEAYPSIKENS
jgi:hypothetical protein